MSGAGAAPAALSRVAARRLALARAGLLRPEWTGFPDRAPAAAAAARRRAGQVVARLGYLQLDAVGVPGARSHAIVLLSRLRGLSAELPETLLRPGAPLFEYWGHEASWIPLELYPTFAFRRREYRRHPWWGDVLGEHRGLARSILARVRREGPVRSTDLEHVADRPDSWGRSPARRVLHALWSCGRLAVRERVGFQRIFDLAERVIPAPLREQRVPEARALETLALRALEAQGWATLTTLLRTWRLGSRRDALVRALRRLERAGSVVRCDLSGVDGARGRGWVRSDDLALAERLERDPPPEGEGVLLSPFDTLLWDRERVALLFGFDQRLEIYKPAAQRRYGYYALPVLSGDRLLARADLRAERAAGRLRVLSLRYEGRPSPSARRAAATALARYADAVRLRPRGGPRT